MWHCPIFLLLHAIVLVSSQTIINVTVGRGVTGSSFTPNAVVAQRDDIVSFTFTAGNNTVTQAAFYAPCAPLENGFDSGFAPVATQTRQLIWNLVITDAVTPIWFYSRQLPPSAPCMHGMMGVINPPASGATIGGFIAAAEALTAFPVQSSTPRLEGVGAVATALPAPDEAVGTALPSSQHGDNDDDDDNNPNSINNNNNSNNSNNNNNDSDTADQLPEHNGATGTEEPTTATSTALSTPTAPQSTAPTTSTSAAVGGAVGGTLAVATIVVAVLWVYHRRRQAWRRDRGQDETSAAHPTDQQRPQRESRQRLPLPTPSDERPDPPAATENDVRVELAQLRELVMAQIAPPPQYVHDISGTDVAGRDVQNADEVASVIAKSRHSVLL